MRQCRFLLIFVAASLFAEAQSVRFRPLSGYDSVSNLSPVGKFGSHTFLLQRTDADSLRLLLLDDSLRLKTSYRWTEVAPVRRLLSPSLVAMGATATFFSQYRDSTGLQLTVTRWDSNGAMERLPALPLGDWNPHQPERMNLYDVAHDEAGGYHLFYKCRTYPGSDSISFKG